MRGEQFRSFVRNEFNRLDHDGGGDIDFAEFRGCFGRYYRPYKALHFGAYAQEAYLRCVQEQLRLQRPGDEVSFTWTQRLVRVAPTCVVILQAWLELELARLEAEGISALEKVSINKAAFATFIDLVAEKVVLRRSSSSFGRGMMLKRTASRKRGAPKNLLDGSNPKFEALVHREFNILDLDESGSIELSEFYSCFGRYYRAFLPHSKLKLLHS